MAHIRNTLAPHFTGHIGPVRFVKGHAETNDTDLVEWFAARPDEYDVDPDESDLAALEQVLADEPDDEPDDLED